MTHPEETAVRAVLRQFQEYYTRRDAANLDACMDLFDPGAEVIGTNGVRPGQDEWYLDRETARQLVKGDWEGWGDVDYRFDSASLYIHNETAWLASSGTVSMTITAGKNYQNYLDDMKTWIDRVDLSAEERLLYVLRGGTNTIYELHRGENFVWPLRFTAVLIRRPDGWKFVQMQFSFPTTHFPDVRNL